MALEIKCSKCGEVLDNPGALIFTPPHNNDAASAVLKCHVCVTCYIFIRDWLLEPKKKPA